MYDLNNANSLNNLNQSKGTFMLKNTSKNNLFSRITITKAIFVIMALFSLVTN